jgi:hypothetical protein
LHYSAEHLKSMLVVLETADMKLALECYKRLEPGGWRTLGGTRDRRAHAPSAAHRDRQRSCKVKYRSPDKNVAREQLMKHLGLFEKDNRQQPPGAVVHPPGARIEFTPIPRRARGKAALMAFRGLQTR